MKTIYSIIVVGIVCTLAMVDIADAIDQSALYDGGAESVNGPNPDGNHFGMPELSYAINSWNPAWCGVDLFWWLRK